MKANDSLSIGLRGYALALTTARNTFLWPNPCANCLLAASRRFVAIVVRDTSCNLPLVLECKALLSVFIKCLSVANHKHVLMISTNCCARFSLSRLTPRSKHDKCITTNYCTPNMHGCSRLVLASHQHLLFFQPVSNKS